VYFTIVMHCAPVKDGSIGQGKLEDALVLDVIHVDANLGAIQVNVLIVAARQGDYIVSSGIEQLGHITLAEPRRVRVRWRLAEWVSAVESGNEYQKTKEKRLHDCVEPVCAKRLLLLERYAGILYK
jgi:hypothetical protein